MGLLSALGVAGCALAAPHRLHDARREVAGRLPLVDRMLADAERFRLQLLISVVETGDRGPARLRRFGFRLGAEYFYPASAIKLAAAVEALALMAELDVPLEVPMTIAPLVPGEGEQRGDATNLAGGDITVAHEIRKMALVSDNRAFNRLLDLVGFARMNERLHARGFASVRINHRLSDPRAIPDPRASAAVTLRRPTGEVVTLPSRPGPPAWRSRERGVSLGRGFVTGDRIEPGPADFSVRNGISLVDLQDLLIAVVRPDLAVGRPSLPLSEASRRLLVHAMTVYPRESVNPVFDANVVADDALKLLLPGIRRVFPSDVPGVRVEVTNKVGQAYGFTVENAYLRHPATGHAVFVAAVLYTNADGVLNDDRYEYDTVARPFMADLGELVARRWLR